MSDTLLSQRFPLVKELTNILIGPFEFVYYLHAIHSVRLTKIVGVEWSWRNLVPHPPNQNLLPTPLILFIIMPLWLNIHIHLHNNLNFNDVNYLWPPYVKKDTFISYK